MPRRILILGPHGSGKSTLVRQVMSLYERRTAILGGVGALPLGYRCEHLGALVVIGNYEETGRDQYGMHQFERYRSNFMSAITYATTASVMAPVLMEGGLTKPRRLETDEGKKFCDGLLVIWLAPANGPRCMRSGLTQEQYLTSGETSLMISEITEKNGAEVHRTCHREDALMWTCDVIDSTLNYRKVSVFSPDYR